jgi:ketosteroid isomerase-like protein
VAAGEQVIRRAYDALNRRDYELMAELADPDFEMDLTERVMNPASYHGAEGMQRFLREIDELWTSMEIRVERVLERGDEALAVVLVAARWQAADDAAPGGRRRGLEGVRGRRPLASALCSTPSPTASKPPSVTFARAAS